MVQEEVKVKLRPTVSRTVRLGVRHPSGNRDQFFFLPEIFYRQLKVCYFVAPSLAKRRVCNSLLLLVLASAVPLGSGSRRTQDHILLSQFLKLPQPGGLGPHIYIPQKQGGPDIPPGTGFPFGRLLRLSGLRWRHSIPPQQGKRRTVLPTILMLCYNIYNVMIIKKKTNSMASVRGRTIQTERPPLVGEVS
jgi:hypothetical protein